MNGCPSQTAVVECQTIQVLEPDASLPVGIIPSAGFDPSMNEQGSVPLSQGQVEVDVVFAVPKAGIYRFEYLYVDALGIALPVQNIPPVVINQTIYGFSVSLSGFTIAAGYSLEWHVVVVTLIQVPGNLIDFPESIRLPLTQTPIFTAYFVNPRSATTYGFTELRVENLTDVPGSQAPIKVQVVAKTTLSFTVGVWPTPPTLNYFLVARTP